MKNHYETVLRESEEARMSQQIALDFIHAMQNDTSLRMKATQLNPTDIDGLMDLAALSGYVFSRSDWQSAVREFQSKEPVVAEHGSMSRVPGFNM